MTSVTLVSYVDQTVWFVWVAHDRKMENINPHVGMFALHSGVFFFFFFFFLIQLFWCSLTLKCFSDYKGQQMSDLFPVNLAPFQSAVAEVASKLNPFRSANQVILQRKCVGAGGLNYKKWWRYFNGDRASWFLLMFHIENDLLPLEISGRVSPNVLLVMCLLCQKNLSNQLVKPFLNRC